MYEYDNKFMYTTLAAAQEMTGLGDAVTGARDPRRDPMAPTWSRRRVESELGAFPTARRTGRR
jgi:ABC-type lipoprotein release transport system permease subunit